MIAAKLLRPTAWVLSLLGGPGITAFSQGIFNSSTMHVNGVAVHVDGEVSNTGTLHNDGVISFTGDWQCQGTYGGSGLVEARGEKPQKITHYGQMSRLLINGLGTKYVKGRLSISEELFLKEGIVDVSSAEVLRLSETAIVSGGSSHSFIDGPLTVKGTGYKFFPIGKDGTYAPIEFLEVKGTATEYSMEVFENAPVISVENVVVRKALYWQRTDIAGSFGGSAVAVSFIPGHFNSSEATILVTGSEWDLPFTAVETVQHSTEADKVISNIAISSPLIMIGEISEKWTDADFYFSTALSPNAIQYENRTVKIFGGRLAQGEFRFQVFNRWGDLVFETASLDYMSSDGWDGRSNKGSVLMGGTYPYRLTAMDKTGNKLEKKGVITIIH